MEVNSVSGVFIVVPPGMVPRLAVKVKTKRAKLALPQPRKGNLGVMKEILCYLNLIWEMSNALSVSIVRCTETILLLTAAFTSLRPIHLIYQ